MPLTIFLCYKWRGENVYLAVAASIGEKWSLLECSMARQDQARKFCNLLFVDVL